MARNILFLCTGNSARSQMGESLLKKHAGDVFQVYSAGTRPREEIFPPVVAVMKEIGIDLSGTRPKGLKQFLGRQHFEYVIIVCGDADKECPAIFGTARRLVWPFDDPAKTVGTEAEILDACRKVRDQMEAKILEWLKNDHLI
jgi:arsenate reductase